MAPVFLKFLHYIEVGDGVRPWIRVLCTPWVDSRINPEKAENGKITVTVGNEIFFIIFKSNYAD
jgi:hypothetical protein